MATQFVRTDVLPDRPEDLATLDIIKLAYVEYVLRVCAGNKKRAARVLGVSVRSLYRFQARAA